MKKQKFSLKLNNTKINKSKFKTNNQVGLSKYKHALRKGYTPNWTTEVFTITKVLNTNPVTYQPKDGLNK